MSFVLKFSARLNWKRFMPNFRIICPRRADVMTILILFRMLFVGKAGAKIGTKKYPAKVN